ncbi:NEL domain-containing protein [Pseudomonas sichuanensis]|uniref:NEL-type E3 ubiquitin ligase domain-containing protein n=1 Tax=Pseudomonas sichuanensis TaxID=2213015 RepID=UPI0024491665|nr:NEL-type E3 ubiquitin ligase domain-containing protein [Pseudomonas sichuanensis]MDH0732495.1 NEL domain-containing protein [Pseudomonas sichuanensis]MDH1582606.1 NEL domain-containing protein [Pseudomonas sichuanensis]MDH1592519.1 NEL domain-containing protein [Pseudomonas sichuanensis]MDH1597729.1 NEL domain-containing protein [Pseudomonas sichuanensis]
MRYEQSSGVSTAQIDQALDKVLAAQTPQALSESLQGRDFWTEHLRARYAERFHDASAPFHARLKQLWHEAVNGPEQAYLEAIEPVVREHEAAQAALRRQLTDVAVASSM